MAKTEPTKTPRKPNEALMKPVQPDEVLAAVVGSTPVSRGELSKKIWQYIKEKNLQDPKDKTMINADDLLKKVFDGEAQVSMFKMNKHIAAHVTK